MIVNDINLQKNKIKNNGKKNPSRKLTSWLILIPSLQLQRNPSSQPEEQQKSSGDLQCPCVLMHRATSGLPGTVESEVGSDQLRVCKQLQSRNVQNGNRSKFWIKDNYKTSIRGNCRLLIVATVQRHVDADNLFLELKYIV